MANESIKLGISFSHDTIRFIEAEEWNGKLNLTSVVQVPLPKVFDFSIIGDQEFVPHISDVLDKSLENFSHSISSARISIDRRLALKKSFAVDKGLSDEDIQKHIEWELEQLLIAPRDEYNVGYEHSVLPDAKSDVIVFVAIRKAIVRYAEDIFKKSRLSLESVDLDLFASVRALNLAHASDLKGASALIEFNPSGIGVTILLDGLYALSTELPATINDVKFDAVPLAELAASVNDELQKLTHNVEENLRVVEIEHVFVAGDNLNTAIIDELKQLRPLATVSVVDLFADVHKQLNIESQTLVDEHGERFMSCLGMIL